jgi:predicted HNH restriction endonuclease
MPNGSVFPLTDAQASALKALFQVSSSDPIPAESGTTEGGRVLQSHYRRERSSLLRNRKLAQAREKDGLCVCSLCGITEESTYPKPLSSRIFEVHHKVPLSKASTPVRTTLDDLIVLCANCHRAVHGSPAADQNYDALVTHFRDEG